MTVSILMMMMMMGAATVVGGSALVTTRVSDLRNGICQRKYIRGESRNVEALRGCRVIEGSLNFALAKASSPEVWAQYSFPELREITGYLFLYDVQNLTSMRRLFPNLMVIRGQELIDTHALIISGANEMQDVGLPSLTNILRGSVWIFDNARLCYVNTVDWGMITGEGGSVKGISKNKMNEQCPNACSSDCPRSREEEGRYLCWGSQDCQRDFRDLCGGCYATGRVCSDKGECCSDQCLGGCRIGWSAKDCYVCKHVTHNGTCMETCPPQMYEYLQRRCVTREECLGIRAYPDLYKTKGSEAPLNGKLYEEEEGEGGKKYCVLECPKDTQWARNVSACVRCFPSACNKSCPGKLVDSIEKARELRGCTRIKGVLKISIRRGAGLSSSTISKELKENLDKIEVIDHHLVITHTHVIVSLDFLQNLRLIQGEVLEGGRYALIVRSNNNLMELWSDDDAGGAGPARNITIGNGNVSRVLFHYNPKLCPRKIWDFVSQSGIQQPKDDKFEIGITNGDKVTCNTRKLKVQIAREYNISAEIRYENFRSSLAFTSHLLGYEIHYKEAPDYPQRNVSKYGDRDPCGEDDWTILEYPKMGDERVVGIIEDEWEDPRLITNLKPYTYYAVYVKTVVIPDENSLNNNTGAESDIKYFKTLPGVPTKPTEVKVGAGGPDRVKLSWGMPLRGNGVLKEFNVYYKVEREDWGVQDQRDYCLKGRSSWKSSTTTEKSSVVSPFAHHNVSVAGGPDCCSCSAGGSGGGGGVKPSSSIPIDDDDIRYQDDMMNQIMNYAYLRNGSSSSSSDNNRDSEGGRNLLRRRKRSITGVVDWRKVTIPVEEGKSQYTLTLDKLTHYTKYVIGMEACRFGNDSDLGKCSHRLTYKIRTEPSPTADNIDPGTIKVLNVTEDRFLQLRWEEPPHPNGVVMGYKVKIQQREGPGTLPVERCVTRKEFQQLGSNYTFPVGLQPGNYSVSIQTASLARDSDWSLDQYFVVEGAEEDINGGGSLTWVITGVVFAMTVIIAGTFLTYQYFQRGNKPGPGGWIFSPNPEYTQIDIPPNWEVPHEKLLLGDKVLGQGSFGKVVEGILLDFVPGRPSIQCAVKTVADDAPSDYRMLFLKEAKLMVKLDCSHVVKLLGVISKTLPPYVIMEMVGNGDLKNYLKSRRPGNSSGVVPPTLREVLRMAAEICDGMAYIHKEKLVHRDLAARNCMVGSDLVVKVGDFGMSREVLKSDYYRLHNKAFLPVRWMPPESLQYGVFTSQSDVWSFGVVLWEMTTLGYKPYQGLIHEQVMQYVVSGRIMEKPENCPGILYDLMSICWEYEAKERPNFIQLLERLLPFLEESFRKVSFYHGAEGKDYRKMLENMNMEEEQFQEGGAADDPLEPLTSFKDIITTDDNDSEEEHQQHEHQIIDDLGELPSTLKVISDYPSPAAANKASPPTNKLSGPVVIHPSPRMNDLSSNNSPQNISLPVPSSQTGSGSGAPMISGTSAASTNPFGSSSSMASSSPSTSASSFSTNTNMNIPNGPQDPFIPIIPFPSQHHHHHQRHPPPPHVGGSGEIRCGNSRRNGFLLSRPFSPINEQGQPVNRTTEC